MQEVERLSRSHAASEGAPSIDRVDVRVFRLRYYGDCFGCSYCHDWCCSHGVDVDEANVARINEQAPDIERILGIPRDRWFEPVPLPDPDFPSGARRRTLTLAGTCVFKKRDARGCHLHVLGATRGPGPNPLKPMVSCLFPVTFQQGLLLPSDEALDGTLVCLGPGPTLYEGVRGELLSLFGEGLIQELDRLQLLAQER